MKRDLGLGALLFAAILAAAFVGRAPQPSPVASRASGDPGAGGLLAWYELERAQGIAVGRFRRRHAALSAATAPTLVVALPAMPAVASWNAAESRALDRWARNGGRAVLVGRVAGAGLPLHAASGGGPLRGPWAAFVRRLDVRPAQRVSVRRGGEVLLADRAGALVVALRTGRGTVVTVAGAEPLENRALGRGDAARLATLLAGRRGVAFDEAVRGDVLERPWYAALDAPERLALALAACAGLLWLIAGWQPLGPAVTPAVTRDPTSAELVAAAAGLYARAGLRARAAALLAADALRRLAAVPATPALADLAAALRARAGAPHPRDADLVETARLASLARKETVRGSTARSDAPVTS